MEDPQVQLCIKRKTDTRRKKKNFQKNLSATGTLIFVLCKLSIVPEYKTSGCKFLEFKHEIDYKQT